jgi:dienelactone hydrolase
MDPQKRVEDLHDAITFLSNHPLVDETKIAVWGLCFDGNIVLATAAME